MTYIGNSSTVGQILRSAGAGASPKYSTATYPATAGTSGNVLTSDGTNWVSSTPAASGVTSVSGTTNRITSTGGTTPVIDIAATYVGQTSITTLGTIATGVWNGTAVDLAHGGTNANLTASNGGIFYSTATAGAILSGTATAGQHLQSGASGAPSWTTATFPATATGTGKVLIADGTNWVASTPTFPNASATTRKIIVSDGTNWVASTETWAVPGTSGNVLTSNGTNWTSAASASGTVTSVSGTANQVAVATGTTTPVISLIGPYTPATYTAHGVLVGEGTSSIVALAAGSSGQVLQSGGASADPAYSTATYPATATGTGTLLRADGTNWVATTSTYPNTNAVSTLLYASSANVMAALATANSAILATNSSGVPSITTASGNWLNTSRTAFMAYMNTAVLNVTGDGTTTYTVIFDTEVFDQANDFTLASSTFTAPVTGRYKMSYSCGMTGGTVINSGTCTMVSSNRNYTNPMTNGAGATTNCSGNINVLADFDAADTATFTVITNDTGGKVDDVNGLVGGNLRTWVSGALIC